MKKIRGLEGLSNLPEERKLEEHHCSHKSVGLFMRSQEVNTRPRSQEVNTRPKARSIRERDFGSKRSYWQGNRVLPQEGMNSLSKEFQQLIATSKTHYKMDINMSGMFSCSLPHHTLLPLQLPHILQISTWISLPQRHLSKSCTPRASMIHHRSILYFSFIALITVIKY